MNDAPLRNTTAPASALSCGSYACMLQRSHHKRSAAFGDARMHACRYGGFGEARPSGAKAEKKDGEGPLSKVRMGRMGRSALRGGGGGCAWTASTALRGVVEFGSMRIHLCMHASMHACMDGGGEGPGARSRGRCTCVRDARGRGTWHSVARTQRLHRGPSRCRRSRTLGRSSAEGPHSV